MRMLPLYVALGVFGVGVPANAWPVNGVRLLQPTPLGVNTAADEDEPHVVGNTLYYSSNAGGKFGLMSSVRPGWTKGQPLENVETEVDDRGAFLVDEKKTQFQYLFFATKKDKMSNNFDIYVTERFDTKKPFSSVLRPVMSIATEEDELHPWITPDLKNLYFSRRTKDGWRVFVVSRTEATGPQFPGEPNVIEELPVGFHHATLTPDGKTMYLQGPLEKDRWGLFRSTKTAKGWGKPEEIKGLNHPDGPTGDRSPCLSRDGKTLYFASDRPMGKGGLDLYLIPTIQLETVKK